VQGEEAAVSELEEAKAALEHALKQETFQSVLAQKNFKDCEALSERCTELVSERSTLEAKIVQAHAEHMRVNDMLAKEKLARDAAEAQLRDASARQMTPSSFDKDFAEVFGASDEKGLGELCQSLAIVQGGPPEEAPGISQDDGASGSIGASSVAAVDWGDCGAPGSGGAWPAGPPAPSTPPALSKTPRMLSKTPSAESPPAPSSPRMLSKRGRRNLNRDKLFLEYSHVAVAGKTLGDNGHPTDYKIRCGWCGGWQQCPSGNPQNFAKHVEQHCRKRQLHVRGASKQLTIAFGFKSTEQSSKGSVGTAPQTQLEASRCEPPLVERACTGVAGFALAQGVKLDAALDTDFRNACASRSLQPDVELFHLAADTFDEYDKSSSDMRKERDGDGHVHYYATGICAMLQPGARPRNRPATPIQNDAYTQQLCEPYMWACVRCLRLEEKMIEAARHRCKNIINTRVILEYTLHLDVGHQKTLKAIKHMHPTNVPLLRADPLIRLRAVAKAREDYLTFKLEDAPAIGPELTKDDKTFLRNVQWAILTNQGDVRNKAIKGSFAAYVWMLRKRSVNKAAPLTGIRYEEALKDYKCAEYLLSKASNSFSRANFSEGASPNDTTLAKASKSYRKDWNLLDPSESNGNKILEEVFSALQDKKVEVVTVASDEFVVLETLQYDHRLQSYVGTADSFPLLSKDAPTRLSPIGFYFLLRPLVSGFTATCLRKFGSPEATFF